MVMMFAMFSAWGVKYKDKKLYIEDTTELADGEFNSYLPIFMGFGKSDKIGSTGIIKQGELISWKRFNKQGDMIEYWDK